MNKITNETLTLYIFGLCPDDQKEIIDLKISHCSETKERYEHIRRNFMQLNFVDERKIKRFPLPLKLVIAASIFISIFLTPLTKYQNTAIDRHIVKDEKTPTTQARVFTLQSTAKEAMVSEDSSFQEVFAGSLKLASPYYLDNELEPNDFYVFTDLRLSSIPSNNSKKQIFKMINIKGIL